MAWHLDRKVPVALILTIAIQSMAAVWWASNLSTRVTEIESSIKAEEDLARRVITLEVHISNIRDDIGEIKGYMRSQANNKTRSNKSRSITR